MKTVSLLKIIVIGISLYQGQSVASPSPFDHCIESGNRFVVQKFIPAEGGDLGHMKFIDMQNRQTIDLFCGYDKDPSHRIEIACVSYLGDDNFDKIIRVRVQRQELARAPKLALLEIQIKGQPAGTINDLVPMLCEL